MAENQATNTTRNIAYVLLGLYGLFLFITLIAAIFCNAGNAENKWLSTFKDNFAFLGGALATIIGYYFGNRNTDVAFDKAREQEEKAKEANQRAKNEETKKEILKTQILDATKKDDSAGAENSPFVTEAALISPQVEDDQN